MIDRYWQAPAFSPDLTFHRYWQAFTVLKIAWRDRAPNGSTLKTLGFGVQFFNKFRNGIPFLQQLGAGLKKWKGLSAFTHEGGYSNPENLLRWKLSSLLDEVCFITDKDWRTKVANEFDAHVCSLSGLTDSKFRFGPESLEGFMKEKWHAVGPHVCKACNCTMRSHYQLVVHHQHGCRGACSRCDDLGLACREWTCKTLENGGQ